VAEELPIPYSAPEQQRHATTLAMWIFLATELMLFGGLFVGYTVYRMHYFDAWPAAGDKLDLVLGTVNTAILLTSSLCMALAEQGMERRARRFTLSMLAMTLLLGAAFLGIKFHEYSKELHENLVPLAGLTFTWDGPAPEAAQMFFNFYFVMTGTHAVHLSVGLLLVLIQFVYVWRWRGPRRLERRVTVTALYWHFVDLIWVFLFPMLYLM
jgi:cytochrome c oxidase subunit 3